MAFQSHSTARLSDSCLTVRLYEKIVSTADYSVYVFNLVVGVDGLARDLSGNFTAFLLRRLHLCLMQPLCFRRQRMGLSVEK
jgi:hypothetical protein